MNLLNSKWFTVASAGLVVLLAILVHERLPAVHQTDQEMVHIKKEISALRQQQEDFNQKKDYYQSDEYQAYQARLKLHYQNQDEKVVYVYHNTVPIEKKAAVDKPQSNLQQWWEYLIGN